jgi:hypothetical protein
LQDPPKFTQNGIFGLKTNHLASLFGTQTKQDDALQSVSGLPDGLFTNQKSQFGYILMGLRLETVDIYDMATWNILQTFGIFYDHLVHFVFIWYIFPVWVHFSGLGTFFRFWYHVPRKIWQPWSD